MQKTDKNKIKYYRNTIPQKYKDTFTEICNKRLKENHGGRPVKIENIAAGFLHAISDKTTRELAEEFGTDFTAVSKHSNYIKNQINLPKEKIEITNFRLEEGDIVDFEELKSDNTDEWICPVCGFYNNDILPPDPTCERCESKFRTRCINELVQIGDIPRHENLKVEFKKNSEVY